LCAVHCAWFVISACAQQCSLYSKQIQDNLTGILPSRQWYGS
jgi:hypothetical protein